jgi:hypothetical protein
LNTATLCKFHIAHSANKQYHPFRANHGFCEVRFAPMSGHRETQSPSPKSGNSGSRGGLIDYDRLRGHGPTLDGAKAAFTLVLILMKYIATQC